MEIRIYQILGDPREKKEMYMRLDELKDQPVDAALYDKVFMGFVNAHDLERVFDIFNRETGEAPENYHGRSLSVSDVVEVIDAEGVAPGFYYCDRFGFKRIPFQPELTHTDLNTLHVVLLEPGKLARETDIDCSLEGLQNAVGDGNIEIEYYFDDDPKCCIIGNEFGRIRELPFNRVLPDRLMVDKDVTYPELVRAFREAERKGYHLSGQITFTPDSFNLPYSEVERTYTLSSDNKAFQPNMAGYSIYASCLDGGEHGVRLDHLMAVETGDETGWKIEKCVVKTFEQRRKGLDIVRGLCFICGLGEENFECLSSEQCKYFLEAFKNPELCQRDGRTYTSIPYSPSRSDLVR